MSNPKVIERPARVMPIPGRLQSHTSVPLHREIERDGQRIVMDLFWDDDASRIVQRGVNMLTGKTLWFALPDKAEASEVSP